MTEYADAVVGVPGEGLNVEQRKRLTIGVELAAKPPLLLFVDEPTSGLDSQLRAILDLLEKLTKAGQAVLCTIHQPSAMLFQGFDRLLFLAKGGKTVYFGDIGENSKRRRATLNATADTLAPRKRTLRSGCWSYWRRSLDQPRTLTGFKRGGTAPSINLSKNELETIKAEKQGSSPVNAIEEDPGSYREFAAPFMVQLKENIYRVFQQYWRTPVYIYAKTALCTLVALFIGFIFFKAPNSKQGLQNQMFAIFQLLTVFGQIVQQSMPQFIIQRSL